eukprot:176317_1
MLQKNPTAIEQLESKWVKIVTAFLYITVIWNVIEGSVSIYFGTFTNDISLFAFGIDSWIEVLSASLVLYHMMCMSLPKLNASMPLQSGNTNKSMLFSLETERKLTLFIGLLLIIFCLFACVGGAFRLVEGIPPSSTKFGIIVGGVCVVAMFVMYYYKTKAAVILNSSTLASDAACSFGCIKLSAVLLIGSILYEIWATLWWVDAATAIIIGCLVGYEGYQTVKGAKDKEKFKGGCGCCGASETGVAKYFRNRFEKELAQYRQEVVGDTCCGGDAVTDKGCCGDNTGKDECCGNNVKSYGAVDANKVKASSGCSGGSCCNS